MSTWAPLPRDDELERADELLDQADALLRRHRGTDPGATRPRAALDDEDLPILTDVVDDFELIHEPAPAAAGAPPGVTEAASAATPAPSHDATVELDRAVAQELEAWITREMPRILARELDQLGERLQAEMLAHIRATLLPDVVDRAAAEPKKGEGPTQAPVPR